MFRHFCGRRPIISQTILPFQPHRNDYLAHVSLKNEESSFFGSTNKEARAATHKGRGRRKRSREQKSRSKKRNDDVIILLLPFTFLFLLRREFPVLYFLLSASRSSSFPFLLSDMTGVEKRGICFQAFS